jgi:glycosyltransferase involved in cell wall biosynthesis
MMDEGSSTASFQPVPQVTVCIPTIGRMKFLPHTLESLKRQTYQNYEVVVLDNACPPDAEKLLQDFANSDRRVRILRTPFRIPMFPNFDRGIRAARGEYMTYFNDDDFYLPTFLERGVETLRENSNVGIVGSNSFVIDETGQVVRRRQMISRTEVVPGHRFIMEVLRRGRSVVKFPSLIYRLSAIRPWGFDPAIGFHNGDLVLLMRMAETHDVAVIAELLWQTRVHADSFTLSVSPVQAMQTGFEMLRSYCGEYAERYPQHRDQIKQLEKRLSHLHMRALLWAWLSASDEGEEQLLGAIERSKGGRLVSSTLRLVARHGLSPGRRRKLLAPMVRGFANRFGL